MRKKIAVIGDKDSVLVFKALGVDVFSPIGKEDIRRKVDTLAKENYGVIFITEQWAQEVPETIARYNEKMLPAVILIPSSQGSLGMGMKRINDSVEKAIGSNIL